jgi:hypothetical protein
MLACATGLTAVLLVAGCEDGSPPRGAWPEPAPLDLGTPPHAIVTDPTGDALAIVSLQRREQIARLPVGRVPFEPEVPRPLARAGGALWVGLTNEVSAPGPELHGLHETERRGSILQALSLETLLPVAEVRVDPALGAVVAGAGDSVLAVHFDVERALLVADTGGAPEDGWATLVQIDTATATRTSRVPVCLAPSHVAWCQDLEVAVVSCWGDDSIAVVRTAGAEPSVLARIPLGPDARDRPPVRYGAWRVLVRPFSSTALVLTRESRQALLADLERGEMVPGAGAPLPGTPVAATWLADGATAAVALAEPATLAWIDAQVGTVVDAVPLGGTTCRTPRAVAATPEGQILVACDGEAAAGSVVAVDAAGSVSWTAALQGPAGEIAVLEP